MNVQIFRFNAQIKIINRKINMKNGTELESLTECVINYCMQVQIMRPIKNYFQTKS